MKNWKNFEKKLGKKSHFLKPGLRALPGRPGPWQLWLKGVLLQLYEHADNNHQLETGLFFYIVLEATTLCCSKCSDFNERKGIYRVEIEYDSFFNKKFIPSEAFSNHLYTMTARLVHINSVFQIVIFGWNVFVDQFFLILFFYSRTDMPLILHQY